MSIDGSGWFAAPNAVFEDERLNAFSQAVLLFLYRKAGSDGASWPSYQSIAKNTGMSRRKAVSAISELHELGWIQVERRRDEAGDATSNLYRLTQPIQKGGAPDALPSAQDAPGVVHDVHHGGAPGAHEGLPNEGLPNLKEESTSSDAADVASKNIQPHPDDVLSLWNEICGDEMPSAIRLTPQRRKKINDRNKDDPTRNLEWWRMYFQRIRASPFCCGDNDRGWRADLDFAVRSEQVIVNVLEGKYTNTKGAAIGGKGISKDRTRMANTGRRPDAEHYTGGDHGWFFEIPEHGEPIRPTGS